MLHPGHQPPVCHAVAAEFVGDQYPRHILQPREQLAEKPGGLSETQLEEVK